MKNVYTWAAKPAKRTITVGDLKAAKGKRKFTQVTANSAEEAEAAEKAGFDMIISNAKNVIPGEVVLNINYRFSPDKTNDEAVTKLKHLLSKTLVIILILVYHLLLYQMMMSLK